MIAVITPDGRGTAIAKAEDGLILVALSTKRNPQLARPSGTPVVFKYYLEEQVREAADA
jgi:hypothetical protein